jgi:hypothetical protein
MILLVFMRLILVGLQIIQVTTLVFVVLNKLMC